MVTNSLSGGYMRKVISVLLIVIFIFGCTKKEPDLKQSNLEKTVADLKVEVTGLKVEVDSLKSANAIRSLVSNIEAVAYLEVGTTAFSAIKTDIGVITVNIADIKPFANGSKIKLIFGNPLNADLLGVKFKIDYGELNQDASIKEDSEKTKEVSLNNALKNGFWNKEEIILEGLSDKKLGYVRIHDLKFTQISLAVKR